jgi:hypothetical protein
VQENHKTYTYTARNADQPSEVVTFTLYNNHLKVNLTGLLDQAGIVVEAEEKPTEIKNQVSTQLKPVAMKLAENLSGPVHIRDVDARLDDEELRVILWQRAAGLRLAPILFNMERIDNVEAAEAFIDEVDQRKIDTSTTGRLWGPLDYWVGWAGLLVAAGLVLRWLRRRYRAKP